MQPIYIVLASAACAGACSASLSEEIRQVEREEIVVTAMPLEDALQPSDVLSGEQLLLKSAATIGETLADELGLSSSYFGPAASRPIIRGLGGSRVTILTDSVSTLDVSDISPDHAVPMEPLLSDQIEIIRGPTTLLYGSAAAGGVVNVTNSRIAEQPVEKAISGGIELRGDTAAEERAIVGRLDGDIGVFTWHLEGFRRETENIDIRGFATVDPDERPDDEKKGTLANSYSESNGYAAGLSWVSVRGYFGASFSQLDQTYGLPGPEPEAETTVNKPEIFEGPFLAMEQVRIDVRGEYQFEDGLWESVKFAYGAGDYEHKEIEPTGEVATDFTNDAWQARVEATHGILSGWHGVLGLQYDDRKFSAIGEEAFISPTTTETIGVFLLEEQDFEWGHLHLGTRIELLEHDNTTFAGYDETAWSLGTGLSIDIAGDLELIFNLSRTERNLSSVELYSDGAHIATRQFEVGLLVVPNGTAKTENSVNIDLGLRHIAGLVRFDANVFYYDISDYVFQKLTGAVNNGIQVAQYSQENADFYGFEAAVMFPIIRSDLFSNELRLFSDYTRAKLNDGRDLPRIPPWRLGANFKLDRDRWLAGLNVIYSAEQNDISSFNTDSYTMVSLDYLYRLDSKFLNWEFFARGTNLLDEEARKSTSFLATFAPLPGRSLHLGLRAKF